MGEWKYSSRILNVGNRCRRMTNSLAGSRERDVGTLRWVPEPVWTLWRRKYSLHFQDSAYLVTADWAGPYRQGTLYCCHVIALSDWASWSNASSCTEQSSTEKTQIYVFASSGIRTEDPSCLSGQDWRFRPRLYSLELSILELYVSTRRGSEFCRVYCILWENRWWGSSRESGWM